MPSYDGADDFMGARQNKDGSLVDPRRVEYVAQRQGARSKILEVQLKSREVEAGWLRRQPRADGPGGAAATAGAGGADGGKGKGKDKDGGGAKLGRAGARALADDS